jgi:hypothetical protein|tara:strand:+ start:2066 stop:2473 length:408 start_codon:yes stop_codon:yes gene_type:complete
MATPKILLFSAPHTAPTPVEQNHIDQALQASQTAMDAIGTITSVSSWALGLLALFIGILALWGYGAIKRAAVEEAKQIANKGLKDYIETDEFKNLVKVRIEKSIEAKWQNTHVIKIDEAVKSPGDVSPFPEGVKK